MEYFVLFLDHNDHIILLTFYSPFWLWASAYFADLSIIFMNTSSRFMERASRPIIG